MTEQVSKLDYLDGKACFLIQEKSLDFAYETIYGLFGFEPISSVWSMARDNIHTRLAKRLVRQSCDNIYRSIGLD